MDTHDLGSQQLTVVEREVERLLARTENLLGELERRALGVMESARHAWQVMHEVAELPRRIERALVRRPFLLLVLAGVVGIGIAFAVAAPRKRRPSRRVAPTGALADGASRAITEVAVRGLLRLFQI
jgi:hypothetical protein